VSNRRDVFFLPPVRQNVFLNVDVTKLVKTIAEFNPVHVDFEAFTNSGIRRLDRGESAEMMREFVEKDIRKSSQFWFNLI